MSGSSNFSKDLDGEAYLNVLEAFDICLERPSDSENEFGFVVDEFPEQYCRIASSVATRPELPRHVIVTCRVFSLCYRNRPW